MHRISGGERGVSEREWKYAALTSNIKGNKVIYKILQGHLHIPIIGSNLDYLCQDIVRDFLMIRNGIEPLHYTVSPNLTHATNGLSIALCQIRMEELQFEQWYKAYYNYCLYHVLCI